MSAQAHLSPPLIPLLLAVLMAWAYSDALAAELQIGDRYDTMISVLGEPSGEIDFGDRQVYFYRYGEVVIEKDRITELKLLTAEEFDQQQQRREASRQQLLAREEEDRRLRKQRAELLRQEKQSDHRFRNQPAMQQLTFWRYLQQSFPEADFSSEIEQAMQLAREEERLQLQEQRFRQLEARTLAAEQRAASAEAAARRAEIEAQQRTLIQPIYPYYPRRYTPGGTSISIQDGKVHFRTHLRSISDVYPPGFQPPPRRPQVIIHRGSE